MMAMFSAVPSGLLIPAQAGTKWNCLQQYARKHRLRGDGFRFGLLPPDDITRTLCARYHGNGSEIHVSQPGRNPRRLTFQECDRLMGFPESFRIVVSLFPAVAALWLEHEK